MYKKRLAAWGFQKNARRSATGLQSPATTESSLSSPWSECGSVQILPSLDRDDNLMLTLLDSVRIWSMSFYETVQSRGQASTPVQLPWPEESEQLNFTLKLVTETLDRGHGVLAGRMARKAFLVVEEMLTLEGPALVWNLLEIMHHMVTLSHTQLFNMLLAHLLSLVDTKMPSNYPLHTLLRALRAYSTSLSKPKHMPGCSPSASSPSSPSSLEVDNDTTSERSSGVPTALSHVLERAWSLNAEMLFDRFDQCLFQLYFRIHFDSCSIVPPVAIMSAADRWRIQIRKRQISDVSVKAQHPENFIQIRPFKEDTMIQRLFTAPTDAALPPYYESLRVASISQFQHYANSILSNEFPFTSDKTVLLRILAGLVTVNVLENWPATGVTSNTSRIQAGNLACIVRTLAVLNATYSGDDPATNRANAVEVNRSIVALREYAQGETDPRVIREMWFLEDSLVAAGQHQEAEELRKSAYWRLEKYARDIPLHSVSTYW